MGTFGIALGAAANQRNIQQQQALEGRRVGLGERTLELEQQQAQVAQTQERRQQANEELASVTGSLSDMISQASVEIGDLSIAQAIDAQLGPLSQRAELLAEGGDTQGGQLLQSQIDRTRAQLLAAPTALGVARGEAAAGAAGIRQTAQEFGVTPIEAARGAGVLPAAPGIADQPAQVVTLGAESRAALSERGIDLSGLPDNTVVEVKADGTIQVENIPEVPEAALLDESGGVSRLVQNDVRNRIALLAGATITPTGISFGAQSQENQILALAAAAEATRLIEDRVTTSTDEAARIAWNRVNTGGILDLPTNREALRTNQLYRLGDGTIRRWNGSSFNEPLSPELVATGGTP